MHAPAQLYPNGSKFTKIAIVAALHVGLVAGLMNSKLITSTFPPAPPPVFVPPLKPLTPPIPSTALPLPTSSNLPTITPPEPLDIRVDIRQEPIVSPVLPHDRSEGKVERGTNDGATGTGGATAVKAEPKPERIYSAALANADACALPAYPARSLREGSEGTVTLALLIGTDGRVSASRIERSSGHPELDRAAMAALKLCAFKPATVNGVPESAWGQIAYVWTLD